MPRIAVLGLHLESNRFAPPTTREDFNLRSWLEGEEILADAARPAPRQPPEVPAFLAEIRKRCDPEILPIIVAGAEPGGPLDDAVLEMVMTAVRAGLYQERPVDGVYVSSHGAMVGVKELDPDGALLVLVRELVGPDVPVVATLDLHANLSDRMVEAADCLIGYRTNPHVDQAEVAREAAIILARMVAGEKFHQAFLRMPLTPPSVTLLTNGPGTYSDRVAEAAAMTDPEGDLVNATVLGGFVYSDTPDNGIAITVTATDRARAEREAAKFGGTLWAERSRFQRRLTPVTEAMALITDPDGRRWILSDSGDNPGGGGRGTTTELLAALIDAGASDALYGMYVDESLAAEAVAAGVGATITARFLRDGPDAFGTPLTVEAVVAAVSDGEVVGRRGLMAGTAVALGPTAALGIGGVTVVVTSMRKQCADPIYFEHLGLNPGDFRSVTVKSRGHFRAGFDEFFDQDQVLEVDTKGLTSPVLSNFEFQGLPRPVYPLDPETTWTPPDWAVPHLEALDLLP